MINPTNGRDPDPLYLAFGKTQGNPYSFHDSSRFKCGGTDEDLYKIFMTGLDGPPMPSWSDNIKPDEFYLRSLRPMKSKEEGDRQTNRFEAGCSKCCSSAGPAAMKPHPSEESAKDREKQMNAHHKVAAMTSALLLLAFGLLCSTGSVSAAGEGKITGTVKLDGTAPHMKGIDMSKVCVKQLRTARPTWRMWWWDRAGGWGTLCFISPRG